MSDKTNKQALGNGKNPTGQIHVGVKELLTANGRDTKTTVKYQVADETVATDNLQR